MPRVRRPLLALIALVIALAVGYGIRAAQAGHSSPRASATQPASPSATQTARPSATRTPLSSLPAQVAQTVTLVAQGGPFPYPRDDGVVFHNIEGLLPREPDGYYREYTVPTPGSADRGARRIITAHNGEIYYTPDHYDSFLRVDTTR